jgi:MoxR-like ATPase
LIERLSANIRSAVVVQSDKLQLILVALIARGHLLLNDVPGIGKTLVAKALALSLAADFKRVQSTPDLLPSDITGSSLYDQRRQEFIFVPGSLFAHVVLVDEINRATPRTQSSLLEALAEGQVTTDGVTRPLAQPFFVIATQNPVETAGTFPLPEAQLDRFLFALSLGYPGQAAELLILEREEHTDPLNSIQPALSHEDILRLQAEALKVEVARPIDENPIRENWIRTEVKEDRVHTNLPGARTITVADGGTVQSTTLAPALGLAQAPVSAISSQQYAVCNPKLRL